jgi:hypothetical protein
MSKKIEILMPLTDREKHLKDEVTRLSGLLLGHKTDAGRISDVMGDILAQVKRAKPPEMCYDIKSGGKVSSPVVLVVHATDWHIGEFVKSEQVEGFGGTDYKLACARIGKLGHMIAQQADLLRNAYTLDECRIIGTADWISGDIHDELIRTNEFPAPVQAVKSGFLLGAFIAGLSAHFKRVKVDLITAGNHDRLTRKPQSSDGGLNSFGYIACEIAKQHVADCPNVDVKIHSALSAIVEVAGVRYLITHGDGIKGTWGIPFYGIERKKQKEAMARMNMEVGKHFDKIVIGHFHTALNHEHWIIGGSLTGTNAFDHKEGRYSRPHQTSWCVHPRHGEFNFSRWWL